MKPNFGFFCRQNLVMKHFSGIPSKTELQCEHKKSSALLEMEDGIKKGFLPAEEINGHYHKNFQFHQDEHWGEKIPLKSWNMSHKTQNRYPQSLAGPNLNEAFDSSWVQEMENNWGAETLSCVGAHGQELCRTQGCAHGNILQLEELKPPGANCSQWNSFFSSASLLLDAFIHLPRTKHGVDLWVWWCSSQKSIQGKASWKSSGLALPPRTKHCHSSQETEHRKVHTVSKPLLPYFLFSPSRIFKLICLASSRCHTKSWHMVHGAESIIWLLLLFLKWFSAFGT